MHLLFLGLTKSVIALMRKFATYLKVCTPFVRRVEPFMKKLKDFQLSFCRLEIFMGNDSGKLTAGWLCGHCIAFSRVMLVYFAPLFHKYTMQEREPNYIQQERACKALLISFYVMISLIMSPLDVDPSVIKEHIKVFMTCADVFHQYSGEVTKGIFWKDNQFFYCPCLQDRLNCMVQSGTAMT